MRRISLNARQAHDDANSAEIEVALFCIEHPSLDAPVRLSTDPTERLSIEPLSYGTRSTWRDADPVSEPYQFILMAAEFPSDLEDAPAATSIVLENVDNNIAALLRSFTDRPVAHMAVVMASSPDQVEAEFTDMRVVTSEGDNGEMSLEITRIPIEDETVPVDRFTKDRFPGMYL